MEEHAAAWTKPSRPSNGSNLVVIPRTYTGGRSPRSWVQLHAEQPHPALRQLASPTRGQRMLCESQPPVSYAEAKTHRLSARALVSCSAARRRNDSAAATNGPFLLPPTNPHRPFISSPPPPDIVSLLTPGASPHASKYAALLRRLILRLLATLFIYLPH